MSRRTRQTCSGRGSLCAAANDNASANDDAKADDDNPSTNDDDNAGTDNASTDDDDNASASADNATRDVSVGHDAGTGARDCRGHRPVHRRASHRNPYCHVLRRGRGVHKQPRLRLHHQLDHRGRGYISRVRTRVEKRRRLHARGHGVGRVRRRASERLGCEDYIAGDCLADRPRARRTGQPGPEMHSTAGDPPGASVNLCSTTACIAGFGGYSGPSVPVPYDIWRGAPTEPLTHYFDRNFNNQAGGPGQGYANWLQIDLLANTSFTTLALWNGDEWGHEHYASTYAWNVNVYTSSADRFAEASSVKCAGPFPELWWTKASLDATVAWRAENNWAYYRPWSNSATPWVRRSKVITCAATARYIYITFTSGTWNYPAFGEIEIFGPSPAFTGAIQPDPGPWTENSGYMRVQFSPTGRARVSRAVLDTMPRRRRS